jgi:hypothetical protein
LPIKGVLSGGPRLAAKWWNSAFQVAQADHPPFTTHTFMRTISTRGSKSRNANIGEQKGNSVIGKER